MPKIFTILIACLFISTATFLNAQSNTPAASEDAKRACADALILHLKNKWDYSTFPDKFKDFVVVKLMIDKESPVLEKMIT